MKTYKIEVNLKITTPDKYSEKVIAESDVSQRVTCLAREVRAATTKIVRQAVDNMSQSAESGLKPMIAEEPVDVESRTEPDALSV